MTKIRYLMQENQAGVQPVPQVLRALKSEKSKQSIEKIKHGYSPDWPRRNLLMILQDMTF